METEAGPNEITVVVTGNGDPSPARVACRPGTKVRWVNMSGQPVGGFSPPACVSPQDGPVAIPPGEPTRVYTVNAGAGGSYEYRYSWPGSARGTRSGTIDVGNM